MDGMDTIFTKRGLRKPETDGSGWWVAPQTWCLNFGVSIGRRLPDMSCPHTKSPRECKSLRGLRRASLVGTGVL